MKTPIAVGWHRMLALGIASLVLQHAGIAADPPTNAASRNAVETPKRSARDVDVYYGTLKVLPAPRSGSSGTQSTDVRTGAVQSNGFRKSQGESDSSAELAKSGERPRDPISISVNTYSVPLPTGTDAIPNAPWPGKPSAPVAPAVAFATSDSANATTGILQSMPNAQPTVIVLREAAPEPRQTAPIPSEGGRSNGVGTETLLGIGIGALGLGFGFANWKRRPTPAPPKIEAPAMPMSSPVVEPGSIVLMGKYNAGLPTEKAEAFEIGPSFQAEVIEKKKAEEQNLQAAMEFILTQNLALHAEIEGTDSTAESEPN
jgi:hypothetical protein